MKNGLWIEKDMIKIEDQNEFSLITIRFAPCLSTLTVPFTIRSELGPDGGKMIGVRAEIQRSDLFLDFSYHGLWFARFIQLGP
jgi:hypothetical protein